MSRFQEAELARQVDAKMRACAQDELPPARGIPCIACGADIPACAITSPSFGALRCRVGSTFFWACSASCADRERKERVRQAQPELVVLNHPGPAPNAPKAPLADIIVSCRHSGCRGRLELPTEADEPTRQRIVSANGWLVSNGAVYCSKMCANRAHHERVEPPTEPVLRVADKSYQTTRERTQPTPMVKEMIARSKVR